MEQKWINPRKRLPKEGKPVLAYWDRTNPGYYDACAAYYLLGQWYFFVDDTVKTAVPPTGWIPFPERGVFAEDEPKGKPEAVNHPNHYKAGSLEAIDIMLALFGLESVKGFCECNAFKYIWRHNNKNGIEDMRKANWYLNKYIELSNLIMEGGED